MHSMALEPNEVNFTMWNKLPKGIVESNSLETLRLTFLSILLSDFSI